MKNGGYFSPAVLRESRRDLLQRVFAFLESRANLFDAVAFRGMSGAMLGPAIADRFDKCLIAVRKPEDGKHHGLTDGFYGESAPRYLIVDDFVCSGETVRAIQTAVAAVDILAVPVAVLLYNECDPDWTATKLSFPVWAVKGKDDE